MPDWNSQRSDGTFASFPNFLLHSPIGESRKIRNGIFQDGFLGNWSWKVLGAGTEDIEVVVHTWVGRYPVCRESTGGWARMEGKRYLPAGRRGRWSKWKVQGDCICWMEGLPFTSGGDPCIMVNKFRSGREPFRPVMDKTILAVVLRIWGRGLRVDTEGST